MNNSEVEIKDFPNEENGTEIKQRGLARIDDVGEYLAVSRSHVYKLMEGGLIDYVRLGNARRIPWEAVYEFVERNRVKASAQVESFELEDVLKIMDLEEDVDTLDTQVHEGNKIIEELQKENALLKQQINTRKNDAKLSALEQDAYLTKDEVAVLLKVSTVTVARYYKAGKLKGIRRGSGGSGRLLFKREDVRQFMESRRL